jgi:hypothetical protein
VRRSSWITIAIAATAFLVFWTFSFRYPSDRPDLFALADAFAHGRTWVDPAAIDGPWDRIDIDGRTYLPFGPLPALVLAPLVAITGPGLGRDQAVVDSIVAALCVALAYRLIARSVPALRDRLWLVALFALSTPMLPITVRGGPWHQDQLFATACSLAALLEATGRRRPLLLGLLGGAAALARAPTALALPLYAWIAATDGGRRPLGRAGVGPALSVAAAALPAFAFMLWYDQTRFGTPLETGYAIATLPPFLEQLRAQGLFSLAHVPRNLDYFLAHPPRIDGPPLYARPDGLGLSVLLTSPGLLSGVRADGHDRVVRACALTAVAVFVPSLLYYGGGWVQTGFRYFLDAIPFLLPAVASAARDGLGLPGKLLIAGGILVGLWTIPWLYGF